MGVILFICFFSMLFAVCTYMYVCLYVDTLDFSISYLITFNLYKAFYSIHFHSTSFCRIQYVAVKRVKKISQDYRKEILRLKRQPMLFWLTADSRII